MKYTDSQESKTTLMDILFNICEPMHHIIAFVGIGVFEERGAS